MREFVCDLIRNCEAAGGRTDGLEGVWLRQLLKKGRKFEDFAKVWPLLEPDQKPEEVPDNVDTLNRLKRMDRMLQVVMRPHIKAHCPREHAEMQRHDDDATYSGGTLYTGLQLLFKFLQAHSTRGELNHGARLEQIHALKYPGDKHIVKFYNDWVAIINDTDTKIDTP